jgi:peroxiredoxin
MFSGFAGQSRTFYVFFPFDNRPWALEVLRMVAVNSTMLPLGTRAPDFRLPDVCGKTFSLADSAGASALLVIFMCNHCPYVRHIRDGLARLARDYQPHGVAVVGINSNDVANYPADSPARMAEEAASAGYIFPYLYDETQAVAQAYRAACTPDLYLFDKDQRLVYRGQFDDSRPGNGVPVTGKDVRAALDAVLAGKPVSPIQRPSIGCNIKWKPGNEPEYS